LPVGAESSLLHFPSWRRRYEAALCETDNAALFKKVEIAESAMLARRDVLAGAVEHSSEWQAIDDAVAALRALKKERLHF
jgi:hypothetical protein